eukprot:112924-Alexandrium_andersonii.AAC.1
MSASLVGSEMCIRDRRFTVPLPSISRNWLAAFGGGRATSAVSAPAPHTRCLLYTSDAADDM